MLLTATQAANNAAEALRKGHLQFQNTEYCGGPMYKPDPYEAPHIGCAIGVSMPVALAESMESESIDNVCTTDEEEDGDRIILTDNISYLTKLQAKHDNIVEKVEELNCLTDPHRSFWDYANEELRQEDAEAIRKDIQEQTEIFKSVLREKATVQVP